MLAVAIDLPAAGDMTLADHGPAVDAAANAPDAMHLADHLPADDGAVLRRPAGGVETANWGCACSIDEEASRGLLLRGLHCSPWRPPFPQVGRP